MLISRVSKLGFRICRQLSNGTSTSSSRTRPTRWIGRCLQIQGTDGLLLNASHTRYSLFCTTSSQNASEEGTETKERITVTFVNKDGEEKHIKVPVGMSMLEAAHQNDIELEGACEGSLACSTCHVIVMDPEHYNKLEEPTDDENDMLDLAFGLTEMSRLGCQVIAKPEIDGIRLALPAATRNFAVDGYVPKPH